MHGSPSRTISLLVLTSTVAALAHTCAVPPSPADSQELAAALALEAYRASTIAELAAGALPPRTAVRVGGRIVGHGEDAAAAVLAAETGVYVTEEVTTRRKSGNTYVSQTVRKDRQIGRHQERVREAALVGAGVEGGTVTVALAPAAWRNMSLEKAFRASRVAPLEYSSDGKTFRLDVGSFAHPSRGKVVPFSGHGKRNELRSGDSVAIFGLAGDPSTGGGLVASIAYAGNPETVVRTARASAYAHLEAAQRAAETWGRIRDRALVVAAVLAGLAATWTRRALRRAPPKAPPGRGGVEPTADPPRGSA